MEELWRVYHLVNIESNHRLFEIASKLIRFYLKDFSRLEVCKIYPEEMIMCRN